MATEGTRHFQNCKEIFAELSAYLDMELPEDACREIDEHLADCAPCVEFVDSLRRTVGLFRQYEAGARPGPLDQSSRQQLLDAFRKMLGAKVSGDTPAG